MAVRKSPFTCGFRCGRKIQTSKMPSSQIFRAFSPKGWFGLYEGRLSPLEGMVTLIIYLIINWFYLAYLLASTGVNQESVNRHR